MKTIKNVIAIIIFIIMILSKISYSYNVDVIYPSRCPELFSYLHSPSFTLQVKFEASRSDSLESNTIFYKIFVEQNGISIQMDGERIGYTNEEIINTINLQNFPNFCHNELAVVKVEVRSYSGANGIYTGRGYFVWYMPGRDCNITAMCNGTSQLLNTGFCTFVRNGDCSLSNGDYHVKQFKITFTLNGNFTDSIPVLDPTLCLGYNGACPQHQRYWGGIISQTQTQVVFVTFVYELYNILGQYFGYVPCRPEEAAIAFHYVRRPALGPFTQFPLPYTPINNTGFILGNVLYGGGNMSFEWRDSNFTQHNIYGNHLGQVNQIRVGRPEQNGNIIYDEPPAESWLQCCNQVGCSQWGRYRLEFGNDPHGCPTLGYRFGDSIYISENSILNESVDNPGVDIVDFTIMNNLFMSAENPIQFDIHETENDRTYLDELKLFQATVNNWEEVAVMNNDKIINYIVQGGKTKIVNNLKEDITDILSFVDNEYLEMNAGDKLTVTCTEQDGNYIILSLNRPNIKETEAGIVKTKNGNSYKFFSKNYETKVCIMLDKNAGDEFDILVKQSFALDQVALVNDLGTAEVKRLDMTSAIFNDSKDVNKLLSESDGQKVTLSQGENIKFAFTNNINTEKKSKYILKATGHYIKGDNGKPHDLNKETNSLFTNKLYDNTPNPFNPETNIKFEIPEDGFVKLRIYDIVGREVKSLVNEFKTAGRYEVTFDGSGFASGVYFYKIETNGFVEIKKMTLIK